MLTSGLLAAYAFCAYAAQVALSRLLEAAPYRPRTVSALLLQLGATAAAIVLTLAVYALVAARCGRRPLTLSMSALALAALAATALLLEPQPSANLAAVVYGSIGAVLSWHAMAMATDVLGPERGLRQLGWVGAGGFVGAVAGRWATIFAYRELGAVGSIAVAAAFVALGALIVTRAEVVWSGAAGPATAVGAGTDEKVGGEWTIIGLAGLVSVLGFAAVEGVRETHAAVMQTLPHGDAAARDFRGDLRWVGWILGVVLLVVVVPRLLQRAGVGASLVLLPSAALAASVLLAVVPVPDGMPLLSGVTMLVETLQPSVFVIAVAALFLPLSRRAKYGPQVAVAVLASAAGTILGSGVLVATAYGGLTATACALLDAVLCVVAIAAAMWAGRVSKRLARGRSGR